MTESNEAIQLAKYFFKKTNRRATKATMVQSIGQARNLLNSGFKVEEIIKGIDWCCVYPPPKGFNSIGWLSYDLENILRKIKAQEVKAEFEDIQNKESITIVEKLSLEQIEKRYGKETKDRITKDFDLNLFE